VSKGEEDQNREKSFICRTQWCSRRWCHCQDSSRACKQKVIKRTTTNSCRRLVTVSQKGHTQTMKQYQRKVRQCNAALLARKLDSVNRASACMWVFHIDYKGKVTKDAIPAREFHFSGTLTYQARRDLKMYRRYASVPNGDRPIYLHMLTSRGLQRERDRLCGKAELGFTAQLGRVEAGQPIEGAR
jgi:hypothetical protein